MGAGIASLLWPATRFCIINRPAPGEHLGESIKEIKAINQSFIIFNRTETRSPCFEGRDTRTAVSREKASRRQWPVKIRKEIAKLVLQQRSSESKYQKQVASRCGWRKEVFIKSRSKVTLASCCMLNGH